MFKMYLPIELRDKIANSCDNDDDRLSCINIVSRRTRNEILQDAAYNFIKLRKLSSIETMARFMIEEVDYNVCIVARRLGNASNFLKLQKAGVDFNCVDAWKSISVVFDKETLGVFLSCCNFENFHTSDIISINPQMPASCYDEIIDNWYWQTSGGWPPYKEKFRGDTTLFNIFNHLTLYAELLFNLLHHGTVELSDRVYLTLWSNGSAGQVSIVAMGESHTTFAVECLSGDMRRWAKSRFPWMFDFIGPTTRYSHHTDFEPLRKEYIDCICYPKNMYYT